MSEAVRVVGGGPAGVEAAWQIARAGVRAILCEMRPQKMTPAHKTGHLAELVCSNSLRAIALENAVGLLKEEMARLGSLVIEAAHSACVPAGGALAVDRDEFCSSVESRLASHPLIELRREEITSIEPGVVTIAACGPLASDEFAASLERLCGMQRLHYYDAASPIVASESLDRSRVFEASRYGKGAGPDYLNIPLDRDTYLEFVSGLIGGEKHQPHGFEKDQAAGKVTYFEGCLPIEEMARRGVDTLRFGPLKPVGIVDPHTGVRPYAVVQLRRENAAGTAYNLVGFQTRLSWPAQKEVFAKLPGLQNAEWIRLGVMHRNTFVDSPKVLADDLSLRVAPDVFLAGQITGSEGYVEAAATGIVAGVNAARRARGDDRRFVPPAQTALGSLLAYLRDSTSDDFQPQNVSFAYMAPLDGAVRDKRLRRRKMADRALAIMDGLAADLELDRTERSSRDVMPAGL
ncbi:MAG: methylenetetrahydrofolate--tRNA-(uracil(54)-C(5))-methyltransferase (FADH(2)-oxidizing) TrmFO [Candidatus Eremiobacteraeota bacterium]|nr:methylenetetrahydrofolate--tRNA-(uracil(54)-C(5))-methyltransferase (FADH(2)-oxidizing) TrmFO [Candidatus Eremiobacteraeota bacterium]MBC5826136.1 methylenetetrahydrofolate--tRNA-(uracil(54)-C(5))-methyltransferase (FADH(2)-oxidizing) TrmFO [Candidatus Eremiobacteraeota bacterium]